MQPHEEPPARRGRGAGGNPPNRYERIHVTEDPAELEDEELRQVPTEFFLDDSQSILSENDSPDVPFDYSINPYRGCEHGCVYCLAGETRILMADGRTRPIRELEVGDRIIGTRRDGWYRKFVETEVLDHWSTAKQAYRIDLADGTSVVASADHRFLTDRGWKFVTGAQQGSQRRPHLTEQNRLLGLGAISGCDLETDRSAYRRGYLSGMIRGDAHLAIHRYERAGRRHGDQYHFRLVLADRSALERTRIFLSDLSIATHEFQFETSSTNRKSLSGIRTHARASVERIMELTEAPPGKTDGWRKGFLAGIFDAEGSYSSGILRISNSNPVLLSEIEEALTAFGFSYAYDVPRQPGNRIVQSIRLTGGLREHLRFFRSVGPAISRKCSPEGRALKFDVDLSVSKIEPVGERRPMYDLTTGTGDFIANGLVSHNCYARPTHEYLGFSAGLDFESKILVKRNAPELLEKEFGKKSWTPQVVAVSGSTDSYQPGERELEVTRECLEVFLEVRNPVSIITKNELVTRDADILEELADRDLVHVTLSVTSLKDEVIGKMEPRTSRPERRLKAVEELADRGIPVGINIAPVIPGLTDEEIPRILEEAAERGAQRAGWVMLRLPGPVEELFVDWLEREFPNRKEKVLNRLRAIRDGKLSDSEFGQRMRGKGLFADTVSSLFRMSCRRLGLNQKDRGLRTDLFRRPSSGQQELF